MSGLHARLASSLGSEYTIGRELGGGGMSRVFLAEETALRRAVVLKVLTTELAAGISAERFKREIRVTARLQEPHIVSVLSAGVADGLPYYTMPYVSGDSLRARLAAGPVPLGEAVTILRDVATALAYAHACGVIHRDVKPENVLLSGGTAVVTDFGIAKAISVGKSPGDAADESTLTRLGTALGTPAYMSPEQAAGDVVDARADLYSWGVVAYEMIAGVHPFAHREGGRQLMAAHITEHPTRLDARRPDAPAALTTLVMRCLAKEAAGRPGSAAELAHVLNDPALLGAIPPVSRPAVSNARPPDARRTRHVAIAALAVLGALLVAALVASWRYVAAR